jgi:hypothetical protein
VQAGPVAPRASFATQPDLLTRIGRDQIAHCSSITYDLRLSEIRLSCAAR